MRHDTLIAEAGDEFLEAVLVFLELVVEALGEAVAVQIVMQAVDDASDVESLFFIEREGDGDDFLEQEFIRAVFFPVQLTAADGFTRKAGSP